MHVYQMRSYNTTVVNTTHERIQICMDALKEVSKVWLVAKMVHTLFMSILGNKTLEERLQKAAGKRHKKPRIEGPQSSAPDSPPKSRFEDMSLGYQTGVPAPQVSFERSRPQSPAATPSRDPAGQGQNIRPVAPMSTLSPTMRHQTTANENLFAPPQSRGNTRPGSPFNMNYSMPASPPDLYLVTRNSPNLSQSLWENFQPDQLFPDTSDLDMTQSFALNQSNLDPALQMAGIPTSAAMGAQMRMPPHHQQQQQQAPPHHAAQQHQRPGPQPAQAMQQAQHQHQHHQQHPRLGSQSSMGSGTMQADGTWSQLSPDDTWSNSSLAGPSVPTTLNVEDWLVEWLTSIVAIWMECIGLIWNAGTSSSASMERTSMPLRRTLRFEKCLGRSCSKGGARCGENSSEGIVGGFVEKVRRTFRVSNESKRKAWVVLLAPASDADLLRLLLFVRGILLRCTNLSGTIFR